MADDGTMTGQDFANAKSGSVAIGSVVRHAAERDKLVFTPFVPIAGLVTSLATTLPAQLIETMSALRRSRGRTQLYKVNFSHELPAEVAEQLRVIREVAASLLRTGSRQARSNTRGSKSSTRSRYRPVPRGARSGARRLLPQQYECDCNCGQCDDPSYCGQNCSCSCYCDCYCECDSDECKCDCDCDGWDCWEPSPGCDQDCDCSQDCGSSDCDQGCDSDCDCQCDCDCDCSSVAGFRRRQRLERNGR